MALRTEHTSAKANYVAKSLSLF